MRRKNPKNWTPKISFSIEEEEIENILEWNMEEFLNLKFMQRQVQTPAGIIDIIAKSHGDADYKINKDLYYVIELKRDVIDAAAFCQVHRYTTYLNKNLSKNGKRVFLPLLIGKNISSDVVRCLHLFDREMQDKNAIGDTFYTLYEMHPVNGISFNYFNPAQSKYEDDFLSKPESSYIQNIYEEIDLARGGEWVVTEKYERLRNAMPEELVAEHERKVWEEHQENIRKYEEEKKARSATNAVV